MNRDEPSTEPPRACADCLRRSWLLAALAPYIERSGPPSNSPQLLGLSGEGLRFDGETTGITRPAQDSPKITNALAVEAWVAVSTYPWNWVPIIDQSRGEEQRRGEIGYSIGIDAFGHVGLQVSVNGKFHTVLSKDPLALGNWRCKEPSPRPTART